ncbi:MAG: rRNA maturation RNase YbeY [Bdellovibrionaceae bacterium]|nr:rRNA maturation RNase YbeY [Pseudobdellovibrionaceae bacterium]
MKVIQVNQTQKRRASEEEKQLGLQVQHIVKFLKTKRVRNRARLTEKKELTVVFLSRRDMQQINLKYRGKDKPTDILSFESADPKSLGELLLCSDVLKVQARQQGHSLETETLYMLIHGVLHLLSYDHELSKREEELMFRIQEICFQHLVQS